MNKFQIEFYQTENGKCPVEDFLLNIDKKMRAKLLGIMGILEDKGTLLREPYSKYLGDGIFEIRGIIGTDISRVLYFFYHGGKIIFTNGFLKKGQKTPTTEMIKAKRYRKDYLERCVNHEEL